MSMSILKAQFTAYTSSRLAKTANGTSPNETTCAAPKEIPFGTKIKVQGTGTKQDGNVYTVTDRGGLVKIVNGRYIFDLWMPTEAQCKKFGRRNGTVEIGFHTAKAEHSSGGRSFSTTSTKEKKAEDLITIAIKELGYEEVGENHTKYGKWYGMDGAAWCHMFVSWCAYQVGILGNLVPKTASTTQGMQWFLSKGRFQYKGKYTPKRNDIIYFKSSGASHVGIVEKVTGNTVHTIEGNTSNRVARRTYSLNHERITGYGIVSKYLSSSDKLGMEDTVGDIGTIGSISTTKKNPTSKKELKYLKQVLNRKQDPIKNVSGKVKQKKISRNLVIQMILQNGTKKFTVPVLDDVKILYELNAMPGKLTFQTPLETKFQFQEGNRVLLRVNNQDVFLGFVFTKNREENGILSVTCYDQLRYLKNKTTMIYKNKTASELIKMIASDFFLTCGLIEDTGYKIKKRIEDEICLFDIIQNALDMTLLSTGEVYVLYDDCGKLTLKNSSNMLYHQCVIEENTAQSYQYLSTIDEDVYNQIKLIYENEKQGTYDVYMAKDSNNINKWGVLQYTEKISTKDVGKLKANALLNYYNQLKRTLSMQGVFGDISVRAGTMLPVILNLDDIKIKNYMMVEKVTHTFSNHQHTMDISLLGGKFHG